MPDSVNLGYSVIGEIEHLAKHSVPRITPSQAFNRILGIMETILADAAEGWQHLTYELDSRGRWFHPKDKDISFAMLLPEHLKSKKDMLVTGKSGENEWQGSRVSLDTSTSQMLDRVVSSMDERGVFALAGNGERDYRRQLAANLSVVHVSHVARQLFRSSAPFSLVADTRLGIHHPQTKTYIGRNITGLNF